jgi:hypothetical protein
MASVATVGNSFVVGAGNKTLTATPVVRTLIACVCVQTGSAVVGTLTDNNADGHGTYVTVISSIFNASGDVTIFYVRNELIQSATSTTWTLTPGGVITGGGIQAFGITGMTIVGTKAIRQSTNQINQPAAGTPAPLFTIAPLTTNCMIGNVANKTNPATMTAPVGWTESIDVGYATAPVSGVETIFVNSGITASTTTWGSASATAFGVQVVEFDTRVGGLITPRGSAASDPRFPTPQKQAMKRSAYFMLGDKWPRRGRLWVPKLEPVFA